MTNVEILEAEITAFEKAFDVITEAGRKAYAKFIESTKVEPMDEKAVSMVLWNLEGLKRMSEALKFISGELDQSHIRKGQIIMRQQARTTSIDLDSLDGLEDNV